jgi:hypothetical protein
LAGLDIVIAEPEIELDLLRRRDGPPGAHVSVMGEPVEQSASEAFGAEHLGPFVSGRDLKCCVDREVVLSRCGFPWEKTTKRPIASPDFLRAALNEGNDVRLSSRKAACSSMAPPSSTGNPGSVYTNCETALDANRKQSVPANLCGITEFISLIVTK